MGLLTYANISVLRTKISRSVPLKSLVTTAAASTQGCTILRPPVHPASKLQTQVRAHPRRADAPHPPTRTHRKKTKENSEPFLHQRCRLPLPFKRPQLTPTNAELIFCLACPRSHPPHYTTTAPTS
jgi:hypothetical protein